VACEIEPPEPLPETGKAVGLAGGIARRITPSDGETIENPKWYRAEQRRLRVVQRRVARRKQGSHRRPKTVRARQRQHERLRTTRQDCLNKLAADLVNRYDTIAIEELPISAMVHNQHLSTSILAAGWSAFRQRLSGNAAEAGRTVVEVNPAYTSKPCSPCGSLFARLTLADRWVECDCGLSLDRDHNAAMNVL
jgi:putative transposase